MTTPILELRDVRKSFGRNDVLKGVDIDVRRGQSLVILGGSGSGKSVMLKNALGLMTRERRAKRCAPGSGCFSNRVRCSTV